MIKRKKLNHWAKKQGFSLKLISVLLSALIVLSSVYAMFFTKFDAQAADSKAKSTGADASTNYSASIGNTPSNIYWTNATYFDYLSDTELSKGWLNADQSGTGFNGSSDDWYPFKQLNETITSFANSNSGWQKPLYFGNFCNVDGSYDTSTHNGVSSLSGVTTANIFNSFITPQVSRFDYAANNSNGLVDYHQSYQGLMENSLSNDNLMAKNSTQAPYFNQSLLGNKVRTVSSFFPFTTSKSVHGGTTYYKFDSNNAQDNVYFQWENTGSSAPNDVVKPTKVYYGSGTSNGVEDGLKYFMSPADTNPDTGNRYDAQKYYGIFPFNNRKNHGDTKTTASNTRYIYASKGESGWSDLYCYFYNSSGYVGQAWPGYKMQSYFNSGDNLRIAIPEGATGCTFNNGVSGSGASQAQDLNDLSFGAYYISGSAATKYVYLSKDNKGWSDDDTYCYFYNDSGAVGNDWPGYQMQSYDSSTNVRVPVPVGATKCIFSKRGSEQTAEIYLPNTNYAFWLSNDGGVNQWDSAPADAGAPSGQLTAEKWGSKPSDAGTASPGDEALDYGFGIRMDMKFKVPDGGYDDDGKAVKFNYSGDDDLWVYITDNRTGESQLVLDLGGNHKKAEGEISFVPKASSNGSAVKCESTANNVYGKGEVKSEFDFDYSHTYTMSIFYMERGMFESNCMMSFSMTIPENNVVVDKEVDTSGVNAGLASSSRFKSLVASESFDFTAYEGGDAKKDTEYSLSDSVSGISSQTTDSSTGAFMLKDKQSADFTTKFTTGSNIYVNEAYRSTNKLKYDTKWKVLDVANNNTVLGSTDTLSSSEKTTYATKTKEYTLIDSSTGATTDDYAELQYDFTNKIQTAPLSITKTVRDYNNIVIGSNSELKDDTFTATVMVDLNDGDGYKTYPLTYSYSDGGSGSGSTVQLKHGRTVTIQGIPVGAKYKVEEDVPSKYTNAAPSVSGTMAASGATASFINTEKAPGNATATIKANKSFVDDKGRAANYTDGSFEFNLYEGTTLVDTVLVPADGEASFAPITYSSIGTHTYTIREVANTANKHIVYDSNSYTATVTVTKNGTELEASVTYNGTTSASTPPTFENTVKTGTVTVNKSNQAGSKLQGITFAVYKVSQTLADSNADYSTVMSSGTEVTSGITNTSGQTTFSGLSVYENNTFIDAAVQYQNYALIEKATDANGEYRLNKKVYYFKFDDGDDLSKEYGYVNGHIKSPHTAGEGTMNYVAAGLLFIALAGVSYAIYRVIKRPRKKKLAHLRA